MLGQSVMIKIVVIFAHAVIGLLARTVDLLECKHAFMSIFFRDLSDNNLAMADFDLFNSTLSNLFREGLASIDLTQNGELDPPLDECINFEGCDSSTCSFDASFEACSQTPDNDLTAWQNFYDTLNGPQWSICAENRFRACSCSFVTCNGEDEIIEM